MYVCSCAVSNRMHLHPLRKVQNVTVCFYLLIKNVFVKGRFKRGKWSKSFHLAVFQLTLKGKKIYQGTNDNDKVSAPLVEEKVQLKSPSCY